MTIERLFEGFLWKSRFLVLAAVVASLAAAVVITIIASVDVWDLIIHLPGYFGHLDPEARTEFRNATVAHVVEIVDGYLLSAILLIFSLGLYELFISDIDAAVESKHAKRLLLIRSLDDLKDRLAKVVLLILVVKFFQFAARIKYDTALDLLYLSLGTLGVAGALYLSHGKSSSDGSDSGH